MRTRWKTIRRSGTRSAPTSRPRIDRDPAAHRFIEPLLYFKGFHAIQTHRLAHWLWDKGRKDFALYLQSRSSAVFQTDINPAARIGRGIFLDHATGLVVGETAVIEDDVSILHGVTLGGTGKENEDRHPKIRRGVMIGAGAKILGNIEVGHCARIAAGSVVLKAVPHNTTVAGVPARVVGEAGCAEPSRTMDQMLYDLRAVRSDSAVICARSWTVVVPGRRGWRASSRTRARGTIVDVARSPEARQLSQEAVRFAAHPRRAASAARRLCGGLLGDEMFGRIMVDDEDEERSYNFEKAIHARPGTDQLAETPKLNAYLRRRSARNSACASGRTRRFADLHRRRIRRRAVRRTRAASYARNGDPRAGSRADNSVRLQPSDQLLDPLVHRAPVVSQSLGKRTVTSAPSKRRS